MQPMSIAIKKQLPNLLTYSRIAVIPLLIATFYIQGDLGHWLTAGLFCYASVTDFLDGYLARGWNVTTNLGRFLDPIADKLLVAAALILLVGADRADVLPAIAILMREIMVSGLREFLMEIRVSMPVSTLAKWKTGVQMGALFFLLLGVGGPSWLHAETLGQILLWLAALLTLVTGYAYLRTGLQHMLNEDAQD